MATRTPRKARQFHGDAQTIGVISSVTTGTVIELLPTVALESPRDVTHKITYLDFSIRRAGVSTTLNKLGFVVWKGKVAAGGATPLQSIDPLSQNSFVMSDADIMLSGGLPIPALVLTPSTDAPVISGECIHVQREVRAMRKFNRANHGVFFQIACSSATQVTVEFAWRTLYLY